MIDWDQRLRERQAFRAKREVLEAAEDFDALEAHALRINADAREVWRIKQEKAR